MRKSIISIILIGISIKSILSEKQQLPVGLILIENVDEPELEIVFRTAVARIESDTFDVFPLVRHVAFDESWGIEKAVCDLISNGVLAIFGPTSIKTTGIVRSICNEYQIPHITFTWQKDKSLDPREREQSSMTIDMYPDNLALSAGFADLVSSYDWNGFTVVYETQDDLEKVQDILQIVLNEHDRHISTVSIGADVDDIGPFMKKLKRSGDNCFVLQVSQKTLSEFFVWANILGMKTEYWYYFITDLDVHTMDLEPMLEGFDSNITGMTLASSYKNSLAAAFRDWQSFEYRIKGENVLKLDKIKTKVAILQDAVKLFGRTLLQLMKEPMELPDVSCSSRKKWHFGRNFVLGMKAAVIEENEGFISAPIEFNENGQRSGYHVDIIQIKPTKRKIASYDTEHKINFRTVVNASSGIEDMLEHKTFRVITKIVEPYLTWRNTTPDEIFEGNNRFRGYSMDLIAHIVQRINAKFEVELIPDGLTGKKMENGKYNGILGYLIDGKADIGICDLTITSDRRKVVDFTTPFMTLGVSILFTKPPAEPPNLFSFLSPFSLEVWLNMATAYLVVSLLIFLLSRLSPDDWENPHPCNENPEEVENIWYISNTTWLTMGSIMGQGCDILPKAVGTRLVTGMWWFFALMMLNSYTANLAAFLTSSRLDSKIGSYTDLAAQSKIKYGLVKDGSTMDFFKTSNDSTFKKMWAAMSQAKPSVFAQDNTEGRDRVIKSKGQYAFFMESTGIKFLTERNCQLKEVGDWLDVKYYGIALPLNSPYRKKISGAILELGEQYDLKKLKEKWWEEEGVEEKCEKDVAHDEDNPDLGLENVGGVFLVLGSGILVAYIIAICEFLWNVQKVAVEEQVTPMEAFKAEALFALKFWIRRKNVHSNVESLHSRRSSKSALLQTSVYSLKSVKTLNNTE